MASTMKLTYFNARGLAEKIRVIFAQAGLAYEDIRIERKEWEELKPKTPFGKLPILEMGDGTVLSESRTIARYLAGQNGLVGTDDLEAAQCDMLVDAWHDLFTGLNEWVTETDASVKIKLFKSFATECLPPFMVYLDAILKKNNGGEGFLVGDKLTWADLTIAHGLNNIDILCPTHECEQCLVVDKFPVLVTYVERIMTLPNVMEWIEKRPLTDH